jgi:hypothetical protein
VYVKRGEWRQSDQVLIEMIASLTNCILLAILDLRIKLYKLGHPSRSRLAVRHWCSRNRTSRLVIEFDVCAKVAVPLTLFAAN